MAQQKRVSRAITPGLNARIKRVVGNTLKEIYPGIDMITFIWLAQQVFDSLLDCCEDELLVEFDQEEEPVAFNSCINPEAIILFLRDNQEWLYEKAPSLKELQKVPF